MPELKTITDVEILKISMGVSQVKNLIFQCNISHLPLRHNRKGSKIISLKTDPEPFNELIDTRPELHLKKKTVRDVEFFILIF